MMKKLLWIVIVVFLVSSVYGVTDSDITRISEDIESALGFDLFATEAVDDEYYGCVDDQYSSGLPPRKWIWNCLRNYYLDTGLTAKINSCIDNFGNSEMCFEGYGLTVDEVASIEACTTPNCIINLFTDDTAYYRALYYLGTSNTGFWDRVEAQDNDGTEEIEDLFDYFHTQLGSDFGNVYTRILTLLDNTDWSDSCNGMSLWLDMATTAENPLTITQITACLEEAFSGLWYNRNENLYVAPGAEQEPIERDDFGIEIQENDDDTLTFTYTGTDADTGWYGWIIDDGEELDEPLEVKQGANVPRLEDQTLGNRQHTIYFYKLTGPEDFDSLPSDRFLLAKKTFTLEGGQVSEQSPTIYYGEIGAPAAREYALSELLRINNLMTVTAWVKPDFMTGKAIIASTMNEEQGWEFGIDDDNKLFFGFKDHTGVDIDEERKSIINNFDEMYYNEWTHVAATFSRVAMNLFINGKKIDTDFYTEYTGPTSEITYGFDNVLYLGSDYLNKTWDGGLEDVRIYDRVLKPWELEHVYYNNHPCFNKFCPNHRDVEDMPYFGEAKSLIKEGTKELAAFIGDTVDIYKQQKPTFMKIIAKDNTTDSLLFKFKDKHYYLTVTDIDQYKTTARTELKDLTQNVLGSANLEASEKEPLYPPYQQDLISLPDGKVYLQTIGYFDQTRWLGLFTGITPYMDFDQVAKWQGTFLTGTEQEVNVEGVPSKITFITHDGRFFLLINGEEFEVVQGGNYQYDFYTGQPGEIEGANLLSVHVAKAGTVMATLEISRLPYSLDEIYQKSFTKTLPITLQERVLRVCANDPPQFAALTVCEGLVEIFDLLHAVPKFLTDFANVMFLYNHPASLEDKEGVAYHVFDFPDGEPYELARYFSNNMFAGRDMALKIEDDVYLLGTEVGKSDLPDLSLTRITGDTHPTYKAEGDLAQVQFNLPLKRQISMQVLDAPNLKIEITKHKTALPKIVDLATTLQARVSTYGAVTVNEGNKISALGTVSLADDDLSVFENKMKLQYQGGTSEFRWDLPEVLPVSIDGGDVLMHYHGFEAGGTVDDPLFTKYTDIYLHYNLDTGSKTHAFDEDFVLAILRGNKLALTVDNKPCLLTTIDDWLGNVTTGFNYRKLRCKTFDGEDLLPSVSSNSDVVTFDFNKNSIKMEVDTNNHVVTFTKVDPLTAAREVATEVDLLTQLDTNVTTYSPVNLLGFSTVSINPNDASLFERIMKITPENDLILDSPKIIGSIGTAKVLAHYKEFTAGGNLFQKKAELTLLYDLDEGEKSHNFNNAEFIAPLINGKKLGLKLADNFYFLTIETTAGFNNNNLRVQSAAGVVFPPTKVTDDQVAFSLTSGELVVTFDLPNNKVIFSSRQLDSKDAVFVPEKDFSATLPGFSARPGIDNAMQVGDKQIYNCDSDTTKEFDNSVFICINPGEQTRLLINKPVLVSTTRGNVVMWYKSKASSHKNVGLHYLLGDVNSGLEVSWDKVAGKKRGMVQLDGQYYLLNTGVTLNQFSLEDVNGHISTITTSGDEGTQQGFISVHGDIVVFNQELVGTGIMLRLSKLPYLLVNEEGTTLTSGQFVSSLGSPVYTLATRPIGKLREVTISGASGTFFVSRLPLGQTRNVLLPNGESIMIDVSGPEGVILRK